MDGLAERLQAPAAQAVVGGSLMDPLRYILPADDAEYQRALELRSLHTHSFSRLDGLCGSIGLCVALLMLRFLWNSAFAALMRWQQASSSGGGGSSRKDQKVLDKVEEEIWVLLGGVLLLVVGWQCMYSVSGYCSLSSTQGCLANWPLIPVEPNLLKYYNIELGWYLHLMLKHMLGLGLADNSTMGAHHVATIALVVLSYLLNIHLVGLLVFAVLNVSSPLLHLSKLANSLQMARTKTTMFAAFAAVFFVTRVLVFPYVIVKSAVLESLATIRGMVEHFLHFYIACNALLLVLCVMQCVWFASIVRILRAALRGHEKELQRAVAGRDPAGSGGKLSAA